MNQNILSLVKILILLLYILYLHLLLYKDSNDLKYVMELLSISFEKYLFLFTKINIINKAFIIFTL